MAQHSQEPPPASWRFIGVYALAYTGLWVALLTPVIVTLALRVRELAPHDAQRTLATLLSMGALCAVVAGPLFGTLSDRTRSRFGMRRPWIVGGMLMGCLSLSLVAIAQTPFALIVSWCLAQFAFNAALAGIVALLADQIPSFQRGTVAGILGVCMPIGQLIGTFIVQLVGDSLVLAFMVPGALGTFAVLLLAIVLKDRRLSTVLPSARMERPAWHFAIVAHRDFWCAWLSRLLLGIAIAFLTSYQPYFFVESLGRAVSEVPQLMFRSMLLQSLLMITASLVFGRLSDRLARRKPFVLLSAMLYALALWRIAGADTYVDFLFGLAVAAIAHGSYFAVDLALVTDVLPDVEHAAARYLGILNITNALPQIAAPLIGAAILAQTGYGSMYAVGALLAVLSAFSLLPIRTR